jgi:hypothetical protein
MGIFKSAIVILLLISSGTKLHAFQKQKGSNDSTFLIQQKIKNDLKEIKRQKAWQIKRIETKDSSVIYGADKKRTHIVHVQSHNRLEKRNVQYAFNKTDVFFIGVLKGSKKMTGSGIKKRNSSYYFDNGRLFYSKDKDDTDDIAFLISEANRYLKEGNLILEAYNSRYNTGQ